MPTNVLGSLDLDDSHQVPPSRYSWMSGGRSSSSAGGSSSLFRGLNAWLDQHVPWARGFERLEAAAELPTADSPSRWCPEEHASWLSRLLFTYADSLVQRGSRKVLQPEDLWDTATQDEASGVWQLFQQQLQATQDPLLAPQGSVWKAVVRCHGRNFAAAGVVKLLHDLVQFAQPALLEALMHELAARGSSSSSSSNSLLPAFGLACAMLCAAVVQAVSVNVFFHMLFRISLHLKAQLVQLLYEKSLRVSAAARATLGVGAIVNLQSNDASKIWSLPTYAHVLWNGPFQILIIMGMLVRLLTWPPALAGLLVTLAVIPVTALLGQRMEVWRERLLVRTDARVKLVTEAVTGIKALKLYAWEVPYHQRIHQARQQELQMVRTTQLLLLLSSAMYTAGPVVVALAAFGTYALLGHPLTAAVAFPSLALFNLLQFPIVMIPDQIMSMIGARVGLRRIQEFLAAEEAAAAAEIGDTSAPRYNGSHKAASSSQPSSSSMYTSSLRHAASFTAQVNGVSSSHSQPSTAAVDGTAGQDAAISITQGTFQWGSEQPVLWDVQLQVPTGALVMVVGPVGSGKSSLLSALLGEMCAAGRTAGEAGKVQVVGSVAYTAQDPWIQNTTLRGNILFGADWNPSTYASTLAACALLPDLNTLPAGDLSEIGEKGVNLSGGQKHRVALARAVYADADVYFLDDPLSAVDAHVGSHLFHQCICGVLAQKTRVLVTHQLQYLPRCDLILVVEGGRIHHQGTYAQLTQQGVDLAQYSLQHPGHSGDTDGDTNGDTSSSSNLMDEQAQPQQQQQQQDGTTDVQQQQPTEQERGGAIHESPAGDQSGHEAADDLVVYAQDSSTGPQEAASQQSTGLTPDQLQLLEQVLNRKEVQGKLTEVEERAEGRVTWAVYTAYFRAWGPCLLLPIALLIGQFGERGMQVLQNYVLSLWSQHTQATSQQLGKTLNPINSTFDPSGLQAPGGQQGLAGSTRGYLAAYFGLGCAYIAFQFLNTWLLVVGTVAAARHLHDMLLQKVLRLPMSFFDSQPTGRLINRFTKDTEAVDLQLAESISYTIWCLVDALCSMFVVLAVSPVTLVAFVPVAYVYYRVQGAYVSTNRELKRLDALAFSPIFQHFGESLSGLATIRAFHKQQQFRRANLALLDASNRAWWPIQVVNRWLSVRLELLGAAVVFLAALAVAVVLPVSAGLAGFALTSVLNMTGTLNWLVRSLTELEVNMNAVERLVGYRSQPEEAPAQLPPGPPPGWPQQGAITAQQLVVRYRPELPLVLHGISFSIGGREKVGICGRTGCGKSTLMMTLFRIVEPASGSICIDGLDIASLGLQQLRSRLSLVPQDPVIFSGTIRSNLDPFEEAGGDDELWAALRQAGVDAAVRRMGAGLDSEVQEGGSNLSTGQRQLLCMARALLRHTTILVLDEATSHVDHSTDALIHKTLREAFGACTVLTIAHRLHTIADVDRVLVLEGGRLVEQGPPGELLGRAGGAYRGLVERAAGHATEGD